MFPTFVTVKLALGYWSVIQKERGAAGWEMGYGGELRNTFVA
jgi:hypothetical protein